MNYNSLICRLCLLDNSGNISIFTNYENDRSGYLAHKIMQVANVQVYEGDGLPSLICPSCLNRIEGFFQFKIQVEKSDFMLRQQFCSYQAETLTSTSVTKPSENIKSEPMPVIKNGVYVAENPWTESVSSFPTLHNCDVLADTVTLSASQEVADVLVEDPDPNFVQLKNDNKTEDKSLLDLTQQDVKMSNDSPETSIDFQDNTSISEKPCESRENLAGDKSTGNYYINSFFSRSDGLDLENTKNAEKTKHFYNLDQNKDMNEVENSPSIQTSSLDNENNQTSKFEDEANDEECEGYNASEDNKISSRSETVLKLSNVSTDKITYCEECDKHFDKPISLKTHQSCHSKESHKCTFCNKSFRQIWYLQSHLRTHTGERPFVCTLCSKTFTDRSALNAHLRVAHFTEKTHVCTYCGKAFKLKKQLDRHERIHTGHQYHRCEVCGKLFTQKSNLMKHLVLHSGEKPFPCPFCEKPFAQKDNLNIHILRHHAQQNPIICDVCGKLFKNKMTLMGHKKSKHSDNTKQIICEVCGKFFPDRSCLNSHKWVHSAGAPVQCDVCGKSYPHARAVRVHKRIVHSDVRKYCCDVCGIGFKTSQTLKHHKVVHTGERAFSCEECGRSFGQKTALKTHQRIHSGVEPYSCPRCGESFKWKQTCDKHIIKCGGKPHRDYLIVSDNQAL